MLPTTPWIPYPECATPATYLTVKVVLQTMSVELATVVSIQLSTPQPMQVNVAVLHLLLLLDQFVLVPMELFLREVLALSNVE